MSYSSKSVRVIVKSRSLRGTMTYLTVGASSAFRPKRPRPVDDLNSLFYRSTQQQEGLGPLEVYMGDYPIQRRAA